MEVRMNAPQNGIGSSINYALKHFVTAIEMGFIYRPNGHQPSWMWAYLRLGSRKRIYGKSPETSIVSFLFPGKNYKANA